MVLIVAAVVVRLSGHHAAPVSNDGFVTTFQRGEFKTVPNACTAVTGATLGQYLPGKRRMVAPRSLNGGAQSLCNWTLDAPPLYRVLEVNAQAYPPSGLATGNGSATNAATDAYQQALATMRHRPGPRTCTLQLLVTELHGLEPPPSPRCRSYWPGATPPTWRPWWPGITTWQTTVVMQGPHARSGRYTATAPQSRAADPVRSRRPRIPPAACTDVRQPADKRMQGGSRDGVARGRAPSRGSGGHPRPAAAY